MSLYINYGCGIGAPEGWENFDASPTLRLQRIPMLGKLVRRVNFPKNVLYGDIVKGLPGIQPESCDGVYCSHVLEHLSLQDCRKALQNSWKMLKPGGIFRCVLPDLESSIDSYISQRKAGDANAAINFINDTMLGLQTSPYSWKEKIIALAGNSHHLWMWDKYSLEKELYAVGFSNTRLCDFNDSADKHFLRVEDKSRFHNVVAFEAIKSIDSSHP